MVLGSDVLQFDSAWATKSEVPHLGHMTVRVDLKRGTARQICEQTRKLWLLHCPSQCMYLQAGQSWQFWWKTSLVIGRLALLSHVHHLVVVEWHLWYSSLTTCPQPEHVPSVHTPTLNIVDTPALLVVGVRVVCIDPHFSEGAMWAPESAIKPIPVVIYTFHTLQCGLSVWCVKEGLLERGSQASISVARKKKIGRSSMGGQHRRGGFASPYPFLFVPPEVQFWGGGVLTSIASPYYPLQWSSIFQK